MREVRLSPASAEDALRDAPEHVQEQYKNSGITLYRELIRVPNSEVYLVEEGYVDITTLPNGQRLHRKKRLRLMPIEDAEERGSE